MITLNLNGRTRGPLTVLCLGAHADDIEIGCGGTLLKLTEQNREVTVHWVVFSATPPRVREARRSAQVFLQGAGDEGLHLLGAGVGQAGADRGTYPVRHFKVG